MISRTIGTGGHHADLDAAAVWLRTQDPLADDYEFNLLSNITEAANTGGGINYNGKTVTFKCTNNAGIKNTPTSWYKCTMAAGVTIDLQSNIATTGTCRFENWYFDRTLPDVSTAQFVYCAGYADKTVEYDTCYFKGSNTNVLLQLNIDKLTAKVYNCKFWNGGVGIRISHDTVAGTDGTKTVENNTIYNCRYGIVHVAGPARVINNAVCSSTNDDYPFNNGYPAGSTYNNNADSDGTLNDVVGPTDSVNNITTAAFISIADTNDNFLNTYRGSAIQAQGRAAILSENTIDCVGNPRPNSVGQNSIGAHEPVVSAPPPAPTASFTISANPVKVNTQVCFTDTSTDDPTSWIWDMGDGTLYYTQNPCHTFRSLNFCNRVKGVYTVTLTAINDFGRDSMSMSVTVIVNDSLENLLGNNTILWRKPNWFVPPQRDFNHNVDVYQYGEGITRIYDITDNVEHIYKATWTHMDKSWEYEILDFFVDHKGRYQNFWLPMWKNHFTLSENIYQWDSTIKVEFGFFADTFQGYERIFIELKDGSHITRHIVSVTDNGDDTETLHLETVMDRNITQNDIAFFGRLILTRFNQDELEFTHHTSDHSDADLMSSFLEVVDEYAAAGAES